MCLRRVLLIVQLMLLLAAPAAAKQVSILAVIDGDTLLAKDSSDPFKVRLFGIDCPEKNQPAGLDAKEFVQKLMQSSQNRVELQAKGFDRYGRTVAIILMGDGHTLQEQLLKNGYAWLYADFCMEARCIFWKKCENDARSAHLGLWGQQNPVAPWDWRKQHRVDFNNK